MSKDIMELKGEIIIDLYKKNGKHIQVKENNLITNYGKQIALTRGLSGLLSSADSDTQGSKILFNYATGCRPWALPASINTLNTSPSKYVNMLLAMSADEINSMSNAFMPSDTQLKGYAYRYNPGVDTKEGQTIRLADNAIVKNNVVRRVKYGESLAATFNVVANSLILPTTGNTYSSPIRKIIWPASYAEAIYFTGIVPPGCGGLADNEILLQSSSIWYKFNLDTCEYELATAPTNYISINNNGGNPIFMDGDYVYDVDARNGVFITVLSKDTLATVTTINMSSVGYASVVYVDGHYYVSTWASTSSPVYELTKNSSGYLASYSAAAVSAGDICTIPGTFVIGDIQNGYQHIQSRFYNQSSNNYYTLGIVDEATKTKSTTFLQSTIGVSTAYMPAIIYYNKRLITFGNDSRCYGCQEWGNLISYHQLSTPIQKEVGDELYVTYSYSIT